jgi:hypothetical protein
MLELSTAAPKTNIEKLRFIYVSRFAVCDSHQPFHRLNAFPLLKRSSDADVPRRIENKQENSRATFGEIWSPRDTQKAAAWSGGLQF